MNTSVRFVAQFALKLLFYAVFVTITFRSSIILQSELRLISDRDIFDASLGRLLDFFSFRGQLIGRLLLLHVADADS